MDYVTIFQVSSLMGVQVRVGNMYIYMCVYNNVGPGQYDGQRANMRDNMKLRLSQISVRHLDLMNPTYLLFQNQNL